MKFFVSQTDGLFVLDVYEVALILGGCFLVNYITADNKTNWVEGFIMVSFYIMIVSPHPLNVMSLQFSSTSCMLSLTGSVQLVLPRSRRNQRVSSLRNRRGCLGWCRNGIPLMTVW